MANRFWVGGSGNWDTVTTTHWSTTSGGASGASAPTSADSVFFDANSAGASYVVTPTAPVPCLDLNASFSGVNTVTIAGSSQISISGNMNLSGGSAHVLWTNSATLNFLATVGVTILTGGVSIASNILLNGAGGVFTLQDNLTVTGSNIVLTTGTLNTNDKTVTAPAFASNNSNTRTITLGASNIILNGNGIVWNLATVTGLTLNQGTSTIKMTDTSATTNDFRGGGKTYSIVWLARGASTAINNITGSNTYSVFRDTGTVAHSIVTTAGTTQTYADFQVNGSAGNLITLDSSTTGTYNFVKSSGGGITANYLSIQHSVATPANTWFAKNSTNNQSVATSGSGWTFVGIATPDQIINTRNQVQSIIDQNLSAPVFPNITQGSVLFAGAAGTVAQNNANFSWDNINYQLSIVGSNFAFITPSAVPLNIAGNANTFVQMDLQNKNAGSTASTDYVASADTATDTTNYIDMGINSSGNTAATWGGALDGYLYASDGNLSIGTQSAKTLYFLTGGGANANRRASIDSAGVFRIGTAAYPSASGIAGNYLISNGTDFLSTDVATGQFSPADPATTTNTTGVMMGLGSTATITTAATTQVLVLISGDIDNNNGADGSQVQIRFGTGVAPANGAALTGTVAGGLQKIVNPNATGLTTAFTPGRSPFFLNAIITVTLATATWIDVSLASITGGTSRIRDLSITLLEI